MKAMVLTAGVGRRMGALTLHRPKPLLPVLGRPLVVQTLHWLHLQGVDEATLNLHHLPGAILKLLGEGDFPGLPCVHFTHEHELLGTAGGVRRAAPLLRGGGPVVVCNSDFLSDIDLDAVLDAHRSSECPATLVLAPWRPGYSVVRIDDAGRVLTLGGEGLHGDPEPGAKWLFTGCQVIDEELIDRIPAEGPRCLVRDLYRPLAVDGLVDTFLHDGFWWEFGSPELYLEGCLRLLALPAGRLRRVSADHDPVRRLGEAEAAVGPGADFDDSARFLGRVALGTASRVGDGVTIEDSAIMPEAWIGPDCRLRRAVIGQGVELPAGQVVEETLICADLDGSAALPPSTRREGGLLRYRFAKTGSG
jgi:NDP-sugar pyrophosphorylase family protein